MIDLTRKINKALSKENVIVEHLLEKIKKEAVKTPPKRKLSAFIPYIENKTFSLETR